MKFSTVFLAALGLIASAAAAPAALTKKDALGEKIQADIEASSHLQFLFQLTDSPPQARSPIGSFIWQWAKEDATGPEEATEKATEEKAGPSPAYH